MTNTPNPSVDLRKQLLDIAYIPPDAQKAPLQLFSVTELTQFIYDRDKALQAELLSKLPKKQAEYSAWNRTAGFNDAIDQITDIIKQCFGVGE